MICQAYDYNNKFDKKWSSHIDINEEYQFIVFAGNFQMLNINPNENDTNNDNDHVGSDNENSTDFDDDNNDNTNVSII